MRVYLTESQVPELGPLPPPLRRLVVRQALAMLRGGARILSWLPSLMCAVGGLAGALIGAKLVGYAASVGYVHEPQGVLPVIWSYTGVAIGSVCAGFVGLHLQRSKLRPLLRRAIGEHEHVTQST
jgi:hypothetical protein